MSRQKISIVFFAIFSLLLALNTVADNLKPLTDDAVAKILIQDSIDSYSGSCACPYNTAKNGSSCGKRSAYSKPGGAAPLCYRSDVSGEMIKDWRSRNK